MPRLYCEIPHTPLSIGAKFVLPKFASSHTFVLRLVEGNQITLFNGTGGEYTAQITSIDKWQTSVEILSFSHREAELPYKLTLAQAIPEASKMDWIIEKAVELGVSYIAPITAQRSVVRLSAERAEKRLARWESIIIAASEQCGRNRLAQLAPVTDFKHWIANIPQHPLLLLTPRSEESLTKWISAQTPQAVTLMIGPEGGFSPDEEEIAISRGAIPLSMGSRILRTETAGTVALASISAIWGGL